jgi:hypothetical protein
MKITTGKQTRAQRVVLYGVESVGKSTFAAQFPKPLFLDIEQGTSHLNVDRCDIGSWRQLTDSLAEAKATDYQTIVIDSADWAERLCVEDLLATSKKTSIEDFGYGKGWVMVAERISRMLTSVDQLIDAGKHVVLIAHSRIVKFEAPDALAPYDRYELKLSKQCSPLLKEFADELWFLRFKTKVSTSDTGRGKGLGGKERILLTTHSAAYDAKTRSGLAEELPLEWASVSHLFKTAKAAPAPAPAPAPEQAKVVKIEDWTIEVAKHGEAATAFLRAKEQIKPEQDWTEASDRVLERMRQDVPKFLATVAAFHSEAK